MVRAVATAGQRSATSEPVLDVGDESLEAAETREPFHQAPEVDRGVVVDEDVSEARETRSTASTVRSWCSAGSRSSPRSSSATFGRVTASASASTRFTSASDAANRRGIYCECRADLRESDPSGALRAPPCPAILHDRAFQLPKHVVGHGRSLPEPRSK